MKNALTNVSDIFYTNYTGTEDAENAYEEMKRSLTRLDEDIINLENRHMNEDFEETEGLIGELKSFIEDQLFREKNYMSTYTPEVLANSIQYGKLYRANTAVAEKQETRTDELQLAYEHEKQRIKTLEEEAAKKRAEEGWKNALLAIGSIAIGTIAIIGTAGMATPVVATAWVAGGSAIAYGASNLVESGQDIYYGTVGDPHTVAVNPIRDTIFCGNQTAYMIWGEVSTTVSGLIVPVGHSYTAAKAVGQSGKLFARTVGATLAKEVLEDAVLGQVSMGAGEIVKNLTGNTHLGTLAGITAGITAGKGSGKALHSVDNAASGIKSIDSVTNVQGLKKPQAFSQVQEVKGASETGTATLAKYGDNFDKIGTYIENPDIKVDWSQYAEHGAERMQQRGMTQEMVDSIVENGKVLSQNNSNKFVYITKEGVAILNKNGKLITTWSSADFDSNMIEITKKLFGE